MKTINDRLADWAITKVEKEFKDDVCLLISHDTLKLEKDASGSSLSYFIPATENAYKLAKTFIINGIGYDLFPMSWERIEGMANLDEYNTSCLSDVKILYCRNSEDEKRFTALQEKLQENLQNQEFMFKKSLEKMNVAMELYQTLVFEESIGKVRKGAGYIADFLSIAVAFVNQTYFKNGQTNQISDLLGMKSIPENFIELYKAIVKADSADELKKLCYLIIYNTRKFLNAKKEKSESPVCNHNFGDLANWYQELCYTWRRIYHWCEQNDAVKSFIWGCGLQYELDVVKEEFGLDDMDLLGEFNANDLSSFSKRAECLEKYIVEKINEHGVVLDAYSSVEDFLEKNA